MRLRLKLLKVTQLWQLASMPEGDRCLSRDELIGRV